MSLISESKTIVNEMYNIIGQIEIEGQTLITQGLIFKNRVASLSNPAIQVNVWADVLSSGFQESKLNTRSRNINIDIITLTAEREQVSHDTLYYLEEKVMELAEDNFNNAVWSRGFLDNDTTLSFTELFFDNYYVRRLPIPVLTRRVVNNR